VGAVPAVARATIGAFAAAGVRAVSGTDSGVLPGHIPGFAEHHEPVLMVQAGLTPMQAITAITGENAKLMHDSGWKACGSVGAGC
jgi:imidazolonepropionase-like amidohydrolase